MKHIAAFFLGLLIAGVASAQSGGTAPARVAVLSLIGDVMTINVYRQQTGTMLNVNQQEVIELPKPVFDHTALLASEDALKKAVPTASVATLQVPKPGSVSDPSGVVVDGKVSASNGLIAALQKAGFTHLLAITKHRALARLQLKSTAVGRGHLQGVGFYVDYDLNTYVIETGESGKGLIAPYVYIKLALVDLSTLAVAGEETVTAGDAVSAALSESGVDPWAAMTPERKVSAIQRLIRENVAKAVPRLFRAQ